MTPNTFLELHICDLLSMHINYAFLRNSDEYPQKITGDIDILIEQKNLKQIYSYFVNLQTENVKVVQIISKKSDLYVMLFFPCGGERKFLVLEYYSGIIYKGQIIISGNSLLENCEIKGIWRRLPAQLSITYTYIHYSIYKGELPLKYQDNLKKYGIDKEIKNEVLAFINNKSKEKINIQYIETPHLLQRKIAKRISKIKTILNYASQILRIRRKSLGCVVKVNPEDAQALIDFAEKYHLYRPTYRFILHSNLISSVLAAALIFLLGGLAIIPTNKVPRAKKISEYLENKQLN